MSEKAIKIGDLVEITGASIGNGTDEMGDTYRVAYAHDILGAWELSNGRIYKPHSLRLVSKASTSPAPAPAREEMGISTANYLYICEKCSAEIKMEDAHAVKHNGIRFQHYCLGCLPSTPQKEQP